MRKGLVAVLLAGFCVAMVFPGGEAAAECGPGSVLIKRKSALFQSMLVTTNTIFVPTYTLAFTLKTSGCSSSGIVRQEQEQELFVAHNLDPLTEQMARGRGAHLEALATLLGCAPGAFPAFSRMTRENFPQLLPRSQPAPQRLLAGVKWQMARDPALAAACSRLG